MYHEIHRLRLVEHFSIQRIADQLSINFRSVKKILDMTEDESMDPEAAEQWGTGSTLEGFILFARKIGESLPDDLKSPQAPVEE